MWLQLYKIHVTQSKGDILVFLTGQEEIETAKEMLLSRIRGLGIGKNSKIQNLIILPIYSSLPAEEQSRIFIETPENSRKVILATNIAETSVTIEGIVYVVDCGFCKKSNYNARNGMDSLVVSQISKASANQRAGRAGRTSPGKCFRLYTAWSYMNELDTDNIPEIQRSNLSSLVLMLKSLGINDLISFDFISPPPTENFIKALEILYALGALNSEGNLTKTGRKMAEFPLYPSLSKMIIKSEEYKCLDQIISIAAMLSVGSSIFYRAYSNSSNSNNSNSNNPTYSHSNEQAKNTIRSFFKPGGDHLTLLYVYMQWQENNESVNYCKENYIHSKSMYKARSIKDQIISICDKLDINYDRELYVLGNTGNVGNIGSNSFSNDFISPEMNVNIRKSITAGFFMNAARLSIMDGTYKTLKNKNTVNIHPNSSLSNINSSGNMNGSDSGSGMNNTNINTNPPYVLYHELVFTNKEYMRENIEVYLSWLMEIAPHYYKDYKEEDIINKTTTVINKQYKNMSNTDKYEKKEKIEKDKMKKW